MSNNVVPFKDSLPVEFRDVFDADELAGDLYDNVSSGFAVVSIRGSKWRIKHSGNEEPLLNDDGEPVPHLEVIMLKAAKAVSKIYYAKDFSEGSTEGPDCSSMDGIVPDASAPNIQNDNCASCKHNQWGSKITPAGKKSKACSDTRRMAVVPFKDIPNEIHDGPMLLRIPAASLNDLALFGKKMAAKGFPYNAIGTRLGFDVNVSFPKLTFKAIRPLERVEMALVAQHSNGDKIPDMLNISEMRTGAAVQLVEPVVEPVVEPADNTDFDPVEAPVEAPVETQPPVAKNKTPKKKKTPAKQKEKGATPGSMSDDLDHILGELDNLG